MTPPPTPPAPPKFPTQIPSITELRERLGYGDGDPRCEAFHDTVRVFRKNFITHSGRSGKEFIDWKKSNDQHGLIEMMDNFLDDAGNGALFWPSDPASPNYNKHQYPDHRVLIRHYLKQLFFRLNLQQHRNTTYKLGKKASLLETATPRAPGRSRMSGSRDDPIDINDNDIPPNSTPESAPVAARQVLTTSNAPIDQGQSVARSATFSLDLVDPALHARTDNEHAGSGGLGGGRPGTPPITTSSPGFVGGGLAQSCMQPLSERDGDGDGRSAKRAKHQHRPTGTPRAAKPAKKTKRAPRVQTAVRSSTRDRRQRHDPNWATTSDIEAVIASPTPVSDVAANEAVQSIETQPALQAQAAPPRVADLADDDSFVFSDFIDQYSRLDPSPATAAAAAAAAAAPVPGAPEAPMAPGEGSVPASDLASEVAKTPARDPPPVDESARRSDNVPRAAETPAPKTQDRAQEAQKQQQQPLVATPKVTFLYRVIHSRTPIYKAQQWKPEGKFMERTVADLERELPLVLTGESKGWLFTFIGPGVETTSEIHCGQDDEFQDMTSYFERLVRGVVRQNKGKSRLVFEIEIEALAKKLDAVPEEDESEETFVF